MREGLGGEVTGAMEKVGFLFGRRCYLAEPSLSKKRTTQKPTRVLHSTLHLMFNPALRSVLGEGWGESNNLLPHPYAEDTRGEEGLDLHWP